MFRAGLLALAFAIAWPVSVAAASSIPLHTEQPRPHAAANSHPNAGDNRQRADHAPLAPVKYVPANNVQDTAESEQQQHEEPWWLWWRDANFWIALFTVVLAVVSGIEGYFIWKGGQDTKAALRLARRQGIISARAAKAAESTVDQMEENAERQLRAYVGVIGGRAFFNSSPSKSASINSRGTALNLEVQLKLKNTGGTPAYKMRGTGMIKFAKSFDPAWLDSAKYFAQNSYVLPGSKFNYQILESVEALNAGIEKSEPNSHSFFVVGRIEYIDAFNEPRWANYCFTIVGEIEAGKGALKPFEHGNDAN